MRAWPAPQVPDLRAEFGDGPVVAVRGTPHGELVAVDPDGPARMYVCGITPYDATHVGHAATYLAYDLLHRAWLDRGLQVQYIQNVTDIDDPLLERAAVTGADWADLAATETQNFRNDMEALRILPPTEYVSVVYAMDEIVAFIEKLIGAGAAYRVDEDVYFDVASTPNFGSILGMYHEPEDLELFARHGGDPDRPGKRQPYDCLLWRAERAGEPSWEAPWGRGRPGWHVECASIALDRLGERFDVQGGGADLAYPHHEYAGSIADSLGLSFAREYVHAAMVGYAGEPMSKSKGNLVMVAQLRQAGHDPMAIRLALMAHHYREEWEWAEGDIAAAESRLETWRAGLSRPMAPPAAEVVESVRSALANDLDAPRALAAVDEWCSAEGNEEGAGATVARAVDALLGISLTE